MSIASPHLSGSRIVSEARRLSEVTAVNGEPRRRSICWPILCVFDARIVAWFGLRRMWITSCHIGWVKRWTRATWIALRWRSPCSGAARTGRACARSVTRGKPRPRTADSGVQGQGEGQKFRGNCPRPAAQVGIYGDVFLGGGESIS